MLSEEGGVGTTSCSSRRFILARGAFAAFRVATAFFDLEDACFDELLLGAALRRRADARAGFAAFFVGFPAFGRLARVDLAPLFRAPDFFLAALVFFRAVLGFLGDEADRRALLALRLAMLESFRNLDSLAISVVLSDAYRKSEERFRASADRNRGPPDPAI